MGKTEPKLPGREIGGGGVTDFVIWTADNDMHNHGGLGREGILSSEGTAGGKLGHLGTPKIPELDHGIKTQDNVKRINDGEFLRGVQSNPLTDLMIKNYRGKGT